MAVPTAAEDNERNPIQEHSINICRESFSLQEQLDLQGSSWNFTSVNGAVEFLCNSLVLSETLLSKACFLQPPETLNLWQTFKTSQIILGWKGPLEI